MKKAHWNDSEIRSLILEAPEVIGRDVENEAKEAIKLLVTILRKISIRFGGL